MAKIKKIEKLENQTIKNDLDKITKNEVATISNGDSNIQQAFLNVVDFKQCKEKEETTNTIKNFMNDSLKIIKDRLKEEIINGEFIAEVQKHLYKQEKQKLFKSILELK